ncbi:MAG: acyl carrier protein [Clostridia bacterium]|nr:acyl carrier protein [Clostridia bacterium]
MDINTRLKSIIANQLQIDADAIADDTDVIEELSADSLDVVEILMTVEEQLSVNVPDEAIPALRTVADMQAYIEENA